MKTEPAPATPAAPADPEPACAGRTDCTPARVPCRTEDEIRQTLDALDDKPVLSSPVSAGPGQTVCC